MENAVRRFEAMLSKTGMQNVTCRIYPGARHELLNDYNKKEVTAEILPGAQRFAAGENAERRRIM